MTTKLELGGVAPAVVTPLRDGQPDLDNLQRHIRTLATEGCDAILLLGTTGEGPSMGIAEREAVIEAGLDAAGNLKVMAGTGCASLSEAIYITRRAYELGVDATVVVPPFYYPKVSDGGLLAFYRRLLEEAVPDDGLLMVYHIPQVSGVPITFELLEGLLEVDEDRVVGIKDSSGDLEHGQKLCARFPSLRVFVGTDIILLGGLQAGAAGCITAGANVLAPLAVEVYHTFKAGQEAGPLQERLTGARAVLDRYPPLAPTLKSLLALRYGTPGWEVRPPLDPLPESERQALLLALTELGLPDEGTSWLKEVARLSHASAD